MEQVIKEYLNINAPKYAEFKGYNEDFIKAVNDFTEGAEPTEQVQQFYDEAIDAVKKFQEGGLIEKFQYGGNAGVSASNKDKDLRATWRNEIFAKLQQELYNKLKLGLEGKKGGITMDQFNDYQSKHANIYNEARKGDFYTTAYKPADNSVADLQTRYQNHGFNDLAIQPNWETRYHINSSNPLSQDKIGTWNADNLFSAITDDRRFGRKGDWDLELDQLKAFQNKLKELGYTYTLGEDDYYKLGLLDPNKSQSNLKKPETPDIQTKTDLQSGIPNVAHKPFTFDGRISEVFPHLFELSKYFGSIRSNKKIRDIALQHLPVTSEVVPEHLNIYGDLAALNQGYNEAAELQQKANRLGANTSDYRTATAINLQGYQQGEPIRANVRKQNNEMARTTSTDALEKVFKNNKEQQDKNNNNYANFINNINFKNDVWANYYNQKYQNENNLYNYLRTELAQMNQNEKQAKEEVLKFQMEKALDTDPEVLKYKKAYREATTQIDRDKAWDNYNEVKYERQKEILPIYYQELAKLRGFRYNPNNNPFMIYAKTGVKISDDGPVRTRSKDLDRRRKSRKDARDSNDKKLERLGRLMYLHAKESVRRK